MPPSVQSPLEHTEDEASDDDIDDDTDEDSYSSEDSKLWVPTKTSKQPGSSAAGQNASKTQPAPAKPVAAKSAATKAAASKFAFKAGFLTGILMRSHMTVVQCSCNQALYFKVHLCKLSSCTCQEGRQPEPHQMGQAAHVRLSQEMGSPTSVMKIQMRTSIRTMRHPQVMKQVSLLAEEHLLLGRIHHALFSKTSSIALWFQFTDSSCRHACHTATLSQGAWLDQERPKVPLECSPCPMASTHGQSWPRLRTAAHHPACTAATSQSRAWTTATWPAQSLPTGAPHQVGIPMTCSTQQTCCGLALCSAHTPPDPSSKGQLA